jgi:hypothetical protein
LTYFASQSAKLVTCIRKTSVHKTHCMMGGGVSHARTVRVYS